ncbi:hypothetical protein D3C74_384420 [compost metagenome]
MNGLQPIGIVNADPGHAVRLVLRILQISVQGQQVGTGRHIPQHIVAVIGNPMVRAGIHKFPVKPGIAAQILVNQRISWRVRSVCAFI